jgi:tetratricopeptide (TPR) repeat protein
MHGLRFPLAIGLAIAFTLPAGATEKAEKYKRPDLPKEELADIICPYSSSVHVKSIDGAEVRALWSDFHEYVAPGFHTLAVRYEVTYSSGNWITNLQSEETLLMVDMKKGHHYVLIPWYFVNGNPVHFDQTVEEARQAIFKEYPYSPAKLPWLENVYFDSYDATGLPEGDIYHKRRGEPDMDWLDSSAWEYDFKAKSTSIPKTFTKMDEEIAKHGTEIWPHRHRELAEFWNSTPDYDRALAEASKIIEIDPHLAQSYIERALIEMLKNMPDAMMADLNKAIEINPEFAAALRQRGDAWINKGETDKAMADYARAIELNACDPWSYLRRGILWASKGDWEKAMADQNRAVGINSKFAPGLVARGNLWMQKGDNDKAIADFTAAIAIDVKSLGAYLGRGQAWAAKKEYDKAITDYSWAYKVDNRNPLPYLGIGMAYYLKGDLDKSIPMLDSAVVLAPAYADPLLARGTVKAKKGDFDSAAKDFEDAQRKAPANAVISESACSMLAQQGNSARAVDYCVKGARIRLEQKDLKNALTAWNAAITLTPSRADLFAQRAETLIQLGQVPSAIADYTQALKLTPGQAEWTLRLTELKAMPGSSSASNPR